MALTKEAAKNLSILSVAEQLGMELKRTGSYSYTWTEHDSFVIDARKNDFHWYIDGNRIFIGISCSNQCEINFSAWNVWNAESDIANCLHTITRMHPFKRNCIRIDNTFTIIC